MKGDFPHESVLKDEVLSALKPRPACRILDVTLGLGGHAEALLATAGEGATLVGVDADMQNLETAKQRLSAFADRCTFHHANFRELHNLNLGTFDIILADIGVSSPHFDDSTRGFSFREDGPLDMRFDRSSGKTAAQRIEEMSQEDLHRILRDYGELRQSRKLSDALKEASPQTTKQAFSVIEEVAGFRAKSIAPQVFQALRIAVNGELDALKALLDTAPSMLNPGGRLGIISFHSLEDRLVKQHFRTLAHVEKDETTGADIGESSFILEQRKAIKPTDAEVAENPRARSARLRVIMKR